MIFSIFKNNQSGPSSPDDQRYVRPMEPSDIADVLSIIEAHDEDDAAEAETSFSDNIDGMYVAVDGGRIVGVTGAVLDHEAEGVCWLSWTYVDEGQRRQGIGRYLVEGLLTELQKAGIRKLFISTGEYFEDGEDIYAAAKAFYQQLGAALELRHENYFEDGEPRCIYGLDLIESEEGSDVDGAGDLVFDGLHRAPESDEGRTLTWRQYESAETTENPKEVLDRLIDEARGDRGVRFLVAALPSDLAKGAMKGLEQRGFVYIGQLKNYYQPGIHQEILHLNL